MTVSLIRTDKNGTKYFEDTCCPKCNGYGYIYEYAHVEGGVLEVWAGGRLQRLSNGTWHYE